MSAEDWRYEYLSDELREYKNRLEEAEKMAKEAQSTLIAAQWQRDKYKAIVEMLEVAYKCNSSNHKENITKEGE
jgi:hypothetical protein